MVRQLSTHSQIEEQLFYPSVRAKLGESCEVLEGLEEHHLVKKTLAELERMRPDHERFRAKMTVLAEIVRHHVEEEENELFEKVRDSFTVEELNDLGESMEHAKETVSDRPHPLLPDQPPLNVLVGLPLALLDRGVSRARELVTEMARRGRRRDMAA